MKMNYLEVKKTNKTKMVLPKILGDFQVRKKVQLMFWRPKQNMKGNGYVFNDYTKRVRCASHI